MSKTLIFTLSGWVWILLLNSCETREFSFESPTPAAMILETFPLTTEQIALSEQTPDQWNLSLDLPDSLQAYPLHSILLPLIQDSLDLISLFPAFMDSLSLTWDSDGFRLRAHQGFPLSSLQNKPLLKLRLRNAGSPQTFLRPGGGLLTIDNIDGRK